MSHLWPFSLAIMAVLIATACGGPSGTMPPSPGSTPVIRVTPALQTPSSTPSSPATTPSQPVPATAAPTAPTSPTADPYIALAIEPFASGLPALTFLTHAGDATGVLYAVGQEGIITALSASGEVQSGPFLDISRRISAGGERGLLGLAFHPDYASNGRLFVNYTNRDGHTVVSEFARASAAGSTPVQADRDSERVILLIEQPFANHNGGMIAFGPDRYLYIGMGDGGLGGDPLGNGQNRTALLGKMLRIDVDGDEPYAIPVNNPFLDHPGAAREIWALGLRNPWRFSFDRETGDLFIGDVGQNSQEEIDAEPAGQGGRNYGWNVMEGDRCFRSAGCDQTGLTLPVAINDRRRGECAIIGGYVYRGSQFPELHGTYVYSDACTGGLWVLDAQTAIEQGSADAFEVGFAGPGASSFGEDEAGELYLVDLSGGIYRVVEASA